MPANIRRATIRLATQDDLPQLRSLSESDATAAHWTEQQWSEVFTRPVPRRLAWVAEDVAEDVIEGRVAGIAGFLVAMDNGPEWELENVAVLPQLRRRGVGRALVSHLVEQARQAGAEQILLEVRASNQGAIPLYQGSGFRLLASRPRYYSNPEEDALIFARAL